MKISCEQAADICNRSQYNESKFWERIKLRLHLRLCKTCKNYSTKNAKLTSLCDKAGLCSLSKEDKENMKRNLGERL